MPKIIEHDGKKYELVENVNVGSCALCAGINDEALCVALGRHCTNGYFIEKRGPGRPRKE